MYASQAMIQDCCSQAEEKMYSGLTPLVVEGTDKIIIMDMREYPGRSVSEPEKEKSPHTVSFLLVAASILLGILKLYGLV